MNREEILDAASRINPSWRKGAWWWPMPMVTMMREYAERAPPAGVDPDKLRALLDGMDDERVRERFLRLVIDAMPPQKGTPTGWDTRMLRKIRSAHRRMMGGLAADPNQKVPGHWLREMDMNEGPKVLNPHPGSTMGRWLDPTGWWWAAPSNKRPK